MRFDTRSKASFGKVGQTEFIYSQVGGGDKGQQHQQISKAPVYVNMVDNDEFQIQEKIEGVEKQKCSQSDQLAVILENST